MVLSGVVGFWVKGFGFRVSGSGFRVWGAGFMVEGWPSIGSGGMFGLRFMGWGLQGSRFAALGDFIAKTSRV